MDKIKIEVFIIIFSILLLSGLGIRAKVETEIVYQDNKIFELENQIGLKNLKILGLEKQLKSLPYSQPLNKIVVSSITGIRVNPLGGNVEILHKGIDLVGKKGTPVKSLLAGKVVEHWLSPGWHGEKYYDGHSIFGGYIVIDHGEELFSLYGHLSKTFIHEDDWVEQGQIIGEMGNTGRSTGCHLHLEIVINPFRYLRERR